MRVHSLVLAALSLAIPAIAQAQSPADWDKVIAAAKAEGRVVFSPGLLGSPSTVTIVREFERIYGIKVESIESRISETRERIRTEQASGRYNSDVLVTSYNVTSSIENNEKFIQPIPNFPNRSRLNAASKIDNPAGTQIPLYTINMGFLVNTRLVPAGEEPKSWADLLNPKWKGKLLGDDPRALGGGFSTFAVLHDKLGGDYVSKLAEQGPTLMRDPRMGERRAAQGEFAVYYPFLFNGYGSLKGLPVRAVVPSEGATYVLFVASMIKNAPHPNAALLFINYMLSEEVQALFAAEALGTTIDGMESKIPADLRPLATAKQLGMPDWRREQQLLQVAKETFK
jgi:iron(III) transport system substrate-binding protein